MQRRTWDEVGVRWEKNKMIQYKRAVLLFHGKDTKSAARIVVAYNS